MIAKCDLEQKRPFLPHSKGRKGRLWRSLIIGLTLKVVLCINGIENQTFPGEMSSNSSKVEFVMYEPQFLRMYLSHLSKEPLHNLT